MKKIALLFGLLLVLGPFSPASGQSTPHMSAADKAALARLNEAIHKLWLTLPDNPGLIEKLFERRFPKSNVAKWQRLQRKVSVYSDDYANLAFALAYYGADYNRNVQRVLKPYRYQRSGGTEWGRSDDFAYPHSDLTDSLETMYGLLAVLYEKRRNEKLLGYLMDSRTDGASGEMQCAALYSLWGTHKIAMLRIAAHSSARLDTMAAAFEVDHNSADLKETLAEVRALTHHRDKRVATAARKIIPEIKSAIADTEKWERTKP